MNGESWKMRSLNCCVCVQVPARPLDRAGLDTPGPAVGREGCLEGETVGSCLRGEEIQEGPS